MLPVTDAWGRVLQGLSVLQRTLAWSTAAQSSPRVKTSLCKALPGALQITYWKGPLWYMSILFCLRVMFLNQALSNTSVTLQAPKNTASFNGRKQRQYLQWREDRPCCQCSQSNSWMPLGLLLAACGSLWCWGDSLQREGQINWHAYADNRAKKRVETRRKRSGCNLCVWSQWDT